MPMSCWSISRKRIDERMKPLSHRIYAIAAIALAVVLFFSLNIVANSWLGTAKLDLTANQLYTVSPGTKRPVASPCSLRAQVIVYRTSAPVSGFG